MTLREAQDILWPKILERANTLTKAAMTNGVCMYRIDGDADNTSPENTCFVGCLIKPGKYSRELENGTAMLPQIVKAVSDGHDIPDTPYLGRWLYEIQVVHDTRDPCVWAERLSHLAPGAYNAEMF